MHFFCSVAWVKFEFSQCCLSQIWVDSNFWVTWVKLSRFKFSAVSLESNLSRLTFFAVSLESDLSRFKFFAVLIESNLNRRKNTRIWIESSWVGVRKKCRWIESESKFWIEHNPGSGLQIAALSWLQVTLSAKTQFGRFWTFDLTSEVTGWPRTLKSGTIGFVSWRATRWFFPRRSRTIRGQTAGGPTDPPHTFDAGKTRTHARINPRRAGARRHLRSEGGGVSTPAPPY